MTEKISLAIGDQVDFTESVPHSRIINTHAGMLVITDASADCGCLRYAVNGCAWYSPDDVKFVADATEESLNLVFQIAIEEEEEDLDDGEGDDDEDDEDDGDQHTPDPADEPDNTDGDGYPIVNKAY